MIRLMISRPPFAGPRLLLTLTVAAIAAAASCPAAAPASGPLVHWPRCAPLCAGGPTSRPRVTAIYVTVRGTRAPRLEVDAYVTGYRRSPAGSLCYDPTHIAGEPGCSPERTTYGRRIGNGVWWLRFDVPVMTVGEATGSSSTELERRYWIAVIAGAPRRVSEGARSGRLRSIPTGPARPTVRRSG
jgi:hypothetical protein